jgi:hypothetical protein
MHKANLAAKGKGLRLGQSREAGRGRKNAVSLRQCGCWRRWSVGKPGVATLFESGRGRGRKIQQQSMRACERMKRGPGRSLSE